MFWIYGGSLQFGNAGQPGYDGSSFASYEDVIVVSANYRTNGESLEDGCSTNRVAHTFLHSVWLPC